MAAAENLTRDEAETRAALIDDVAYEVHLDLTTGAERFGSRTRVRFTLRQEGATFLDATAAQVRTITVDGEALDLAAVADTRIALPQLPAGEHEVVVDAEMAYTREGRGMHRFVDPVDDRVYLHSQFEPFDAHLVYACFDQPDLKATFALTVEAPQEWVVVSNGPVVERPEEGAAGTWRFATTERISPYISAVVAGSYASVHRTHTGPGAGGGGRDGAIEMGWYVRRSLAEHLDADELFEVTAQGLDWYADAFGMPYPFAGTYDQLLVPEFSAGAMENPGCITYSEIYLFRSKVTDASRERRAETILHEMAHMWFGDLVTMRWWDDLWLNESFATFMAVLCQAEATRWDGSWTTFLDAEKAWAKMQDQLPSTHPVADRMPDVESVHQNFDGITYAKGASVLRQLAAYVGQDAFLAGCRDYFERHAWGNTTLPDFLGALERASGRDLAAWRDDWLLTTGINRLAPRFAIGDDGTYTSFVVEQSSPEPNWAGMRGTPEHREVLRDHRVTVGVYHDSPGGLVRDRRVELDVTGATTEVTELIGADAGAVVLVNDEDLTYAKITIDDASTEALTGRLADLVDPLPRAQVWSATWDMLRDGELDASTYVALVVGSLSAPAGGGDVSDEPEIGVLQRLLFRALSAAERYADPANRVRLLADLTHAARQGLHDAAPGSDHQLAWARHWAATARGDTDQLGDVRRLLDGTLEVDGLTVDTDLRWHLLTCLAQAGDATEEEIAAELGRDDTDIGERHALTARAARPDPVAKEEAWQRLLTDHALSHTLSRQIWGGFVQLDQEPVLGPYAGQYLSVLDQVWTERPLDWAIEFSTATFPHYAASEQLLADVDAKLDGDVPKPLRRVLLEQRDTLVRTLAARARDAA